MKKVYILCLMLLSCLPVSAYFENQDYSGRAAGMGNACTAYSGDVTLMFCNPSGAGFIERKSVAFSYSKLYAGVGDISNGYIAVALPLKEFLSIGVYYVGFGEDIFREKTYAVLLGFKQDLGGGQLFSLGVSVKNMVLELGQDPLIDANPYFAGKRAVSGFGLDVGATYRIKNVLSVGVALQNLNQPDIFFVSSDPIPMKIKAGISLYAMQGLAVNGDFAVAGSSWVASAGGEYNVNKSNFYTRLGGEYGSDSYSRLNAGIGYEYKMTDSGFTVSMDYGFVYPLSFVANTFGTHILSLSFKEIPKKTEKEVEEDVK
ncbi:MAG: conjugal transfer protein TraF [Candidatus Firestonebacteria bacterium]